MINNRQANNGRRRGRGGQRPQGGGGNQNAGNGNRIDSRARGNAAQLLEKYKNLAREAQMHGDRVNTEYYLQFADHYFRVLAETRSRFEEQNPGQTAHGKRPNTDIDGDDEDFDTDGNEGPRGNEGDADDGDDRGQRRDARPERNYRQDRDGRQDQGRQDNRPQREDRPQRDTRPEREPRADRDQRQDRDVRPEREARPERDNRDARPERAERDNRPDRSDRRPNAYRSEMTEAPAPAVPMPANEDESPRTEAVPERPRRGRPRREPEDTGEAIGIAAILPPSLGVEGEVVEVKPRRRRVKKDDEPAAAE
ncbi:DUF4167 domain-containing protein [Sphingomonas sp. LT1P40]|uniref:DUF4167 domain-containing protein n=1 Tax=Alteristakelama amylovorans TaxID=3096166 RepID=UPI002FCB3926